MPNLLDDTREIMRWLATELSRDTYVNVVNQYLPAWKVTVEEAERLQAGYVCREPEILQRDFFNSLRAAFEPEEVVAQLRKAGLSHLDVPAIGDRHLIVSGRV